MGKNNPKRKVLKAIGSGELNLNGENLFFDILEDNTKVFSNEIIAHIFKIKRGEVVLLSQRLTPYINEELAKKLSKSITYMDAKGNEIIGMDIRALSKMAYTYVEAYIETGDEKLKDISKNAHMLSKALSDLGYPNLVLGKFEQPDIVEKPINFDLALKGLLKVPPPKKSSR